MAAKGRDLFAARALAEIPKLLTLLDRNPHSPTYGCFDRNYWHYRIIDFPSGMAQEFVWPLALAYTTDMTGNAYHGVAAVRDWVEAGIRYAARSSHADGSCDDYYPFERATGAAAFSLLACLESYAALDFDDGELVAFFARRGDWLAKHKESGQLSNHEALVALCCARLAAMTGDAKWTVAGRSRLDRLLGWQDEEGWFSEYGGADPGYLTLTIALLGRLDGIWPDAGLRGPIEKAVRFAAHFVHPDGTFGGEYASRNTRNFFPHGFELAGAWLPEALGVNDRFLEGLAADRQPCYADDHILGHHMWNDLLAWRDFVETRPSPTAIEPGRTSFPNAGLLVDRRNSKTLIVSTNKGGVFKFYQNNQIAASDTQISLQAAGKGGKTQNAVAHLVDGYDVVIEDDAITVSGALGWAKHKGMTPAKMIVLRLVMLTAGRFFPDLIRKILQKMLITGKEDAPFRFTRRIEWREGGALAVHDEVTADDWGSVEAAGIGGYQTSIYVVMSRVFAADQLQPWEDLTDRVRTLDAGETLRIEREL